MRLLADENIPLAAVHALRAAGHDTAAIADPVFTYSAFITNIGLACARAGPA